MATWFSADLHFGHVNIIRYCDRPYPDVAAMNDGLIARWNAVVAPDDEVWVLGDVAMGRIDESLAHVQALNGSKHLVAGNHDRCWAGHGERGERWIQRYLDAGFDTIQHGEIALEVGQHTVRACHFPYVGDSHDHDRYQEHRPSDDGRWLLHGHVHERWRQFDSMINVGVDAWDLHPVGEAELVALIDAGRRRLDRRGAPITA